MSSVAVDREEVAHGFAELQKAGPHPFCLDIEVVGVLGVLFLKIQFREQGRRQECAKGHVLALRFFPGEVQEELRDASLQHGGVYTP